MTREEFISLRDRWYRRLARSGFVDHEVFGKNDGDCLSIMRSTPEHNVNSFKRNYERRIHYYTKCRQFSHSSPHNNNLTRFEKRVWRLHCNGMSRRQITAHLSSLRPCSTTRPKAGQQATEKFVRNALDKCHALMAKWWSNTASIRKEEMVLRTGLSTEEISDIATALHASPIQIIAAMQECATGAHPPDQHLDGPTGTVEQDGDGES